VRGVKKSEESVRIRAEPGPSVSHGGKGSLKGRVAGGPRKVVPPGSSRGANAGKKRGGEEIGGGNRGRKEGSISVLGTIAGQEI